jgi:hypothetical protein
MAMVIKSSNCEALAPRSARLIGKRLIGKIDWRH